MKLIDFPLSSLDFHGHSSREQLQSILSNINSRKENSLDGMEWVFMNVKIDFTSINTLQHSYPFWDQKAIINPVWLAKLLILKKIEGIHSSTQIKIVFDSILKTIFYLTENRIQHINRTDIQEYISYLLMNNVTNGLPTKRLTPVNSQSYCNGIRPEEWIKTLKEYDLPMVGFANFISDQVIEKELKNAIETLSAGDLTYRDWKDGGSFNHLTLDYGRYYVEHCADFFKQNINVAIALKSTVSHSVSIAERAGFKVTTFTMDTAISTVIIHFLMGKQVSDLRPSYRKKYSDIWWEKLQSCTLTHYQKKIFTLSILDALTSEQEIDQLGAKVGFDTLNQYQREWIKYLVEAECSYADAENQTRLKELTFTEIDCIRKVVGTNIDIDKIRELIKDAINDRLSNYKVDFPLPTLAFFENAGIIETGTTSTSLSKFIMSVEDAGIVQFVALTGWRESEFGFSLYNINIQTNLDFLDQYVHPIRYEIQWIVPKTNGKTKLKREITRSAYRCATQLAALVGAKDDDPCLYSTTVAAKNTKQSSSFIKDAVPRLWKHFVQHYVPFKQLTLLDELQFLRAQQASNNLKSQKLIDLSKRYDEENWERLEQDPMLREAYRRSNDELGRVWFLLNRDSRRNYIWAYHEGTLTPEHKKLVEMYLSEETKKVIHALRSETEVNAHFTRTVTNELLQDCLYPTPHAFRHMWAEAVLRRFDGDVGWMIRSNFKHISTNMWLAYIRNKNNGRHHERVKRKVISSVVGNYFRKKSVDEAGNIGEFGNDYSGAMNKLLRRLFRNTKIMAINELDKAIDQFALTEIEDIKSNPWGYCVLKKRHQDQAKCAEYGVPQRQNASPAFCLGCSNNLTQSGNLDGILLGINNDMNVLSNPNVPAVFQRASYNTVKNALIHLKKLKADKDIILAVEKALEEFQYVSRTS